MNKFYPLNAPCIHDNAYPILRRILESEWVSAVSPVVSAFEEDLSELLRVKYVLATLTGTAALHLAVLSLGIGEGDVVLVPDLTFIAPANAVRYSGAEVVLVDCDRDLNLSVKWVKKFLAKECERKRKRLYYQGRRVKAVLVVHVLGAPADVHSLLEVCREENLYLIEDASESLGSELNGKALGTFGDVGVLSFNGNKIITTGQGGALITNKKSVYQRAVYLANQAKDDPLYYLHGEVGYNYRMSALQAGLGISQLLALPQHLEAKQRIRRLYERALKGRKDLDLIPVLRGRSNYWLNAVRYKGERPKVWRDSKLVRLNELGIQTRPLWEALSRQRPYRGSPYIGRGLSREMVDSVLVLPSDVRLRESDVEAVLSKFCS